MIGNCKLRCKALVRRFECYRMKLGFFAAFILASTISFAETHRVDLPVGCLGKDYPCAVTHQTSGVWQWQGRKLSVSSNTSMVLLSDSVVQLMSGDIWSEDLAGLTVKHGVFSLILQGDVMLNRRDKKLQVVNLNGFVDVQKSGIKDEVIPAGFSSWYEGIAQGGEYRQGVLSPWSAQDIALLFKKMPEQSALVKSKASEYKGQRRLALTESANLYSKVADIRRIASEDKEARRLSNLKAQQEERARIRRLYREKYYNP